MLFGIPTLVIADDPHLLATARAAHAGWLSDAPMPEPEIILRLARDDSPAEEVSPTIRVEGSRLTIEGGGIRGEADAASGEAQGHVPVRLIGKPAALAEQVTDTLLLFVAARRGRVPIHAAGVMIGDRAILLAGASGAGKSTLALAATAAGLPVLSDDTVYIQHEPALHVWGFPRPIHVLPADAPPGQHAMRVRGGRAKHAIAAPGGTLHADRAALVVLARGDRPSIDVIDPADAVAAMARLEPGFDLLRAESASAIEALAGGGAWRLRLTHDPAAAIALLQAHFG